MALSTALAIYFLIWWLTLFAVLPWGVSGHGEDATPGTDPGAPRFPYLKAKLAWTTAVSSVIFAAFAYVYINRLVTLDKIAAWMGFPN